MLETKLLLIDEDNIDMHLIDEAGEALREGN